VRYAETDAMGVVHHASYVVWLELGRSELLRARGVPYREIEARGFLVMLSELSVRYLGAARYDDLVMLRTELTAVRSRQVVFGYRLWLREGGAALLEARSTHIIVASESRRPARLPDDLLKRLAVNGGEQHDRSA
jgi:acyl-CoA thioester hydrolase